MSSLLSKEIGSKLSSIFGKSATLSSQNERQVQKRKRKEQLLEEKQKNSVVSVPKIVPKGIIEDIFADVGRYIPVGMLEEGEERSDGDVVVADNERGNASTVSSSASETGRAKGIFANLLPSFPSKIRVADTNESLPQSSAVKIDSACVFEDSDNDEDDIAANDKDKDKDREKGRESKKQNERKGLSGSAGELELELEGDDKRISGGVDGDLMAPIRAILAAQAVKERAALARSEAKASNSDGMLFYVSYFTCYMYLIYFVQYISLMYCAAMSHCFEVYCTVLYCPVLRCLLLSNTEVESLESVC